MHTSSLHPRPRFLALLPLLIARPVPRGDGNDPDKDKENKNLTALLARHQGDAMALAAQLLGENADYRGKNRTLTTELAAAQGKALKDGEVAVNAERAKALPAYEALGTVDALTTLVTEHGTFKADKERLEGEVITLKETDARTKREIQLREVADTEGLKFSVLADRDAQTPGLTYETKEVDKNGKKVMQVFVKFKDGEGDSAPVKEQTLSEFAAAKWADYLPALQLGEGETSGKRHVAQGGGTGSGTGGGTGDNKSLGFFDKIRKDAEEKTKPTTSGGKPLEERLNMRTGSAVAAAT